MGCCSEYFDAYYIIILHHYYPMHSEIVSAYDQGIPQSQTADKPMALRGRATQQLQGIRKTNKAKQPTLSSLSR